MRPIVSVLLLATALLSLSAALPALGVNQEHSCRCPKRDAGARGPGPCSALETPKFCELIYRFPPVSSSSDRKLVADYLKKMQTALGRATQFELSNEHERIIRRLPPEKWENEREKVTTYLVTIMVMPLIARQQDQQMVVRVGRELLTAMPKIFATISGNERAQITDAITSGSGCLKYTAQEISIMFNSGWSVRRSADKWSCAWALE